MLVVKAPCPRLEEALKEAYRNESRRSDKELESYYKNLTNLTGQRMDNITAVEFLYNTLELEVSFTALLEFSLLIVFSIFFYTFAGNGKTGIPRVG